MVYILLLLFSLPCHSSIVSRFPCHLYCNLKAKKTKKGVIATACNVPSCILRRVSHSNTCPLFLSPYFQLPRQWSRRIADIQTLLQQRVSSPSWQTHLLSPPHLHPHPFPLLPRPILPVYSRHPTFDLQVHPHRQFHPHHAYCCHLLDITSHNHSSHKRTLPPWPSSSSLTLRARRSSRRGPRGAGHPSKITSSRRWKNTLEQTKIPTQMNWKNCPLKQICPSECSRWVETHVLRKCDSQHESQIKFMAIKIAISIDSLSTLVVTEC